MTFGSIEHQEYNALKEDYFALDKVEQPYLHGKRFDTPKIYIGLTRWGREEWVGTLYPSKTKEKEFPTLYAKHFNAIELNATHYKVYDEVAINRWIGKVANPTFKFCPKFYQGVTHRGPLTGKEFITAEFLKGILQFKDQLGATFATMSDRFPLSRKQELYNFLRPLPQQINMFIEVRESSWFANSQLTDKIRDELHDLNIGWVITDSPARRDVVHNKLTLPKAFIRFCCFGDSDLDKFRIQQWKLVLEDWFKDGLQECWFFLHVYNEAAAPGFAQYVQKEIGSIV